MTEPLELFAACTPGLEPLLAAELAELGVAGTKADAGGVAFTGTFEDCCRVNLGSGIAVCVLLRVARLRCLRLPELRRKVANLEWERWLAPGTTCAVRARSKKSKLYHSGAIEQRVGEALAERGFAAGDGVGVHVRFEHDTCTISIDTSGEPLHRRGWRLDAAKAPLRADLAWAALRASGWDRASPLVDPFAGAGTIAIEAAACARGLAPNRLRRFAYERLVPFDAAFRAGSEAGSPAPIVAGDRDAGAVEAIRANAARAGVAADLEVVHAAFGALPFPDTPAGAVVCNPPHGRRIGDARALRDLYAALGKRVAALGAGWRIALITSDRALAAHTGLDLEVAWSVDHGGTRVHLMCGRGG